jgi:hypothetical protein
MNRPALDTQYARMRLAVIPTKNGYAKMPDTILGTLNNV